MRISNDEQFKQYFYLFVLDFPELDNELLEELLKLYLMVHGFTCFTRNDKGISIATNIRDFDILLSYFNKYGRI